MKRLSWKLRRIAAGYRQQDIAARIGISSTRYSALERGEAEPKDWEVKEVEKLLPPLPDTVSVRALLAIVLLLVMFTPGAWCQSTTTVTGTNIQDQNGNFYFPGTVSASIVLNSGQALPAGVPASGTVGPVATTSGGNFSITLASPLTWTFTLCASPAQLGPKANPTPVQVCFTSGPIAISGASQDVSGALNAIAPLLGPKAGVTSMSAGSLPPLFTTSVTAPTTAPALSFALSNANANTHFAGPASGGAAPPSFRSLVGADLPNPSASSLGGVQSFSQVSHQWLNSISTSGVPAASQPAAADLSNGTTGSGSVVLGTGPTIATPTISSPTVTNETLDGTGAAHVAAQVSAATNYGTALGSQTIIASLPSTGNVSLLFQLVQVTAGVGCSAATNSVTVNAVTWTAPGGTSESINPSSNMGFTGNGVVDSGSSTFGTSAFTNNGIQAVVAKSGTSLSYTATSTLASTGCSVVPQYEIFAKAFF